MNNYLLTTSAPQETHLRLHNALSYEAVGKYEQILHYRVPTAPFPYLTFKSVDFDLYEQKPTAEAFRWTDEPLTTLQRSYVFLTDGALIAEVLAQVPALYPLLKAAVKPLGEIFGESKVLQLEALTSDDDTVLRVIVKLPLDIDKPAALMRKFKVAWWFKNCAPSEASLVFDYEIGNGF